MGWWHDQVVPRIVDVGLAADAVDADRAQVCRGLSGQVVEIGFGSGRNLPHYPPQVDSVIGVDPSEVGWSLASERVSGSAVPVTRIAADAAHLPLPDASADALVSTFSLCAIPDVEAALAEMVRVLRPGGVYHFVEHGRTPDEQVRRWQERLDSTHTRVLGCHVDRPTVELLEAAGLRVLEAESTYAAWPRFSSYRTLGRAVRPA